MTVTMPIPTDAAAAAVDAVRLTTSDSLGSGSTRPIKELPRALAVSVLWDAFVALATLPFLLHRPATAEHTWSLTSMAAVACWLLLLTMCGVYDANRAAVDGDLLRRLTMAGVCFAALLPVLLSAAGHSVEPRRMVTTAALLTTAAVLQRRVAQSVTSRAGRLGSTVRVVVSGHRRAVERVRAELATDPRSAFEVVEVCGPGRGGADLSATAQRLGAQAVMVVPCRHHDPVSLRRLGWQLERTGVRLLVATGLHDVSPFRTTMEYAGAIPLVLVRPARLDGGRMRLKTALDAVVGLAALLVLAPLMVVVALVIMAESRGPAVFRQTRIGKDGEPFTIFKFRTMHAGADRDHARLIAATGDSGLLFKLRCDPRVTRVGEVLRRYSLDELPQLLNVVRGEMSLVGPRPALPSEVDRYEPDARRRLAVKPGLTGLWQVSGRSDLSWSDSMRLDLRYVDNWSLAGDLRIVGRTFGAVLSHRGAY